MKSYHGIKAFSTYRRRGSVYVPVMAAAMIVSVISLSAMLIARAQLRGSGATSNRAEAEMLARSAVEEAITTINHDPNWRTRYTNNVESTSLDLGGGTVSWKFVDRDGNLADDPLDRTELHGFGRVGEAVYVHKVHLQPAGAGLRCLEVALHSGGDIFLDETTFKGASETIRSNGDIEADVATIEPAVEAAGVIIGGNYLGSQTSGIKPRTMPGETFLDYYTTKGSRIPLKALPREASVYRLKNSVLSPQSNPYGSTDATPVTNPEGIYVIDCAGKPLIIQNCRIVGTLVLLNPGLGSAVRDSVNWEAAVGNYPVLLTDGAIEISLSYSVLKESWVGANFNPPGTPYPYPDGTSDSDNGDIYTSRIKGLVGVRGMLRLGDHTRVHGAVVAGAVTALPGSVLNIVYNPQFLNYPPPGFADATEYHVAPGSWVRETLP